MIMSDLFFSEQILRDKEGTLTVTLLCRRYVTMTAGNARASERPTRVQPGRSDRSRSDDTARQGNKSGLRDPVELSRGTPSATTLPECVTPALCGCGTFASSRTTTANTQQP